VENERSERIRSSWSIRTPTPSWNAGKIYAVKGSRLCLRCRHLAIWTKQRCLTSDRFYHLVNCTKRVVFGSGLFPPLYGNMMSSTKPEVHINTSQCRRKRTAPRPQVTYAKNLMKFGRVVFQTCEQTDEQAYITLITILPIHCEGEVISGVARNSQWRGFRFSGGCSSLC